MEPRGYSILMIYDLLFLIFSRSGTRIIGSRNRVRARVETGIIWALHEMAAVVFT